MNEAVFKKLFPDLYVDRFTEKNIRVDGRDFNQHRQIMIQKRKRSYFFPISPIFGPSNTEKLTFSSGKLS
jgi:hypothetical protein